MSRQKHDDKDTKKPRATRLGLASRSASTCVAPEEDDDFLQISLSRRRRRRRRRERNRAASTCRRRRRPVAAKVSCLVSRESPVLFALFETVRESGFRNAACHGHASAVFGPRQFVERCGLQKTGKYEEMKKKNGKTPGESRDSSDEGSLCRDARRRSEPAPNSRYRLALGSLTTGTFPVPDLGTIDRSNALARERVSGRFLQNTLRRYPREPRTPSDPPTFKHPNV